MDRQKQFDCLQFDDETVFYEQIDSTFTDDFALVVDANGVLPHKWNTLKGEFMSQGIFAVQFSSTRKNPASLHFAVGS